MRAFRVRVVHASAFRSRPIVALRRADRSAITFFRSITLTCHLHHRRNNARFRIRPVITVFNQFDVLSAHSRCHARLAFWDNDEWNRSVRNATRWCDAATYYGEGANRSVNAFSIAANEEIAWLLDNAERFLRSKSAVAVSAIAQTPTCRTSFMSANRRSRRVQETGELVSFLQMIHAETRHVTATCDAMQKEGNKLANFNYAREY